MSKLLDGLSFSRQIDNLNSSISIISDINRIPGRHCSEQEYLLHANIFRATTL